MILIGSKRRRDNCVVIRPPGFLNPDARAFLKQRLFDQI